MRGFGVFLLLVGLAVLVFGFGMDTTVATGIDGGRVHNIGLLNQKQNTMLLGAALSVVGAILMAMRRGSVSSGVGDANSRAETATRKCPFCAESIKLEAVVCRFCNREIGPVPADQRPPRTHTNFQELLMAKYGVTDNGQSYVFDGQSYGNLEEAVERAREKTGAA